MTDKLIESFATGGAAPDSNDARVGMIQDMVQQLRDDFSERDAIYANIDTVLFQQHQVHIPPAYEKSALKVKSPLAIHIANTIVAALSTNPPQVMFDPMSFGDTAQANSTLREKFFEASWRRQEEESQRRLFRLFMHALVTKGEAVLKTVERAKRSWAKYDRDQKALRKALDEDNTLDNDSKEKLFNNRTEEYKRGLPYPIATTDVPPDTFYYVKGEDGITFACEVKAVPFFDTLERYQASIDDQGNVVAGPEAMASGLPRHEWATHFGSNRASSGGSGRVKPLTMVEAWSTKEVTYILYGPNQMTRGGKRLGRGTAVHTVKHRYGDSVTGTLRGPYFQAQGITTHSRLPQHAGLGILFGFLDLFPMLDSLLSIQSNAAFLYGFPAFKESQAQGPSLGGPFGMDGAEEDGSRTRIEPGTLYPRDIAPVDMPRGGVDLDKTIAFVRQFIELALPSVVQGVVSGEQSGYAITQASQMARMGWQPIVDNAEFALSRRVGFESWLIQKRIGEDVHVWGEQPANYVSARANQGWLCLGPDDLKGIHRYRVRLQPETPADRVTQIRTHRELLELRLETWNDAVTNLGDNPDEVEAGWLLYDLKRDPVIMAELKKRTLKELGSMDEEALEKANAEAMAGKEGQQGAPPPGALPPGMPPGMPPQPGLMPGQPAPGGQPGQQPNIMPNATVMTPGLPGGGMPAVPPPPPGIQR